MLGGIFFEIVFPDKFNLFSLLAYLVMGLIFVFVPQHLFSSMPIGVMALVLTGVALYLSGVVFYMWQLGSYHHAAWHLFVLFGVVCPFAAMFQRVISFSRLQ